MQKNTPLLTSILLSLMLVSVPGLSHAQSVFNYNPNSIISDTDFFNVNTMSEIDIQKFLESKNSYLGKIVDSLTQMKPSKIISLIAQEYSINPKVILTTLQKEQSLIENGGGIPNDDAIEWAMGYAICDSCSKNDPVLQDYKGLFNQIKYGTAILRKYEKEILSSGQTRSGYGPGKTVTIDNTIVTPVNTATALLYTYTPHIHGNENFAKIWQRWFPGLGFPDGTLVQIQGQPAVYVIQDGTKRPFASKIALTSRGYKLNKILVVESNKIDAYPLGSIIKYPQYALLESEVTGSRYLLVDDQKRKFENNEVFRELGFNPEEIEIVSSADLNQIPDGKVLSLHDAYPTGALLQNSNSGAVYFVEGNTRHPIIDKSIMNLRFGTNPKLISTDNISLKSYVIGTPLTLHDGELIISDSGDPAVYVISNGQRRPIASGAIFEELGYSWDDIVAVPQKVVDLHPLGSLVAAEADSVSLSAN